MPAALAFAAGAMLFVVSHEIIPESHRAGRSAPATFGLLLGVLAMLELDVLLG
ncbi:MAG TPA: ZIP family metal transporter, partial [Planctomycetota bacterium]|nr:ZIP family metal transporter [Planctomycetota bacterium]